MGDDRSWLSSDRHKVRLSDLRPPREHETPEHELAARLEESESARRALEARVAELEGENTELRAMAVQPAGGADAEVERLRRELAAAHEIIRAIEAAYIAGENCEQ